MGGGLWMSGLRTSSQPALTSTKTVDHQARTQIRELEYHVARLSLLNQALWELLRDRLGLADSDLERIAHAVDLRDGVEDGQITKRAVRCPTCGRISNSKHHRCLYCGQEFERPVMG